MAVIDGDGQQPGHPFGEMSPLAKVPLEVFLRITSYLSTQDLGSVRLTCRTAERSLFRSFATEFFTKRQFMISSNSLHALDAMASSDRVSDWLRHVIIGLDTFQSADGDSDLDPPQAAALTDWFMDQQMLLASGVGRDLLARALSKLRNLEGVELRDYNSKARYRDRGMTWFSYGASTARRNFGGEQPTFASCDSDPNWATQVLAMLLGALAHSTARPRLLELNTRSGTNAVTAAGYMLLPQLAPALQPVLDCLERVFLHVSLDTNEPLPAPYACAQYGDLCRLLCRLTAVRHLRLNFNEAQKDQIEEFLGWFAKSEAELVLAVPPHESLPLPWEGLVPPLSTPCFPTTTLERLDIGRISTTENVLMAVIFKFRHRLRGLSLHHINLVPARSAAADDGDSNGDANGDPDPNEIVNRWCRFFHDLGAMPDLDLHYMLVRELSQEESVAFRWPRAAGLLRSPLHFTVKFRKQPGPAQPWTGTTEREYNGRDFRGFLRDLDLWHRSDQAAAATANGDHDDDNNDGSSLDCEDCEDCEDDMGGGGDNGGDIAM